MSKNRDLADFISSATISTAEIADDAVTAAKIDSTGTYEVAALGIGVSSPSTALDVLSGSASTGALKVKNASGASASTAIFEAINGGGNTRLIVQNDGSVGIGTDTPDTLVELRGADPILTIRDTNTSSATSNATLRLAETGASDSLDAYWDIKADGGQLQFIDNWNEGGGTGTRVVINDGGSVGIGTSSITSGFKMEVTGDARFGDAYNDDAVELGWSAGGSVGFVQAYDRGASAFRDLQLNNAVTITSGGSVGIGTSPASIFQVRDVNPDVYITSDDTGQSDIYFGGSTSPTKGRIQYSDNSDLMAFWVDSTERFRIHNSGYISVGDNHAAGASGMLHLREDSGAGSPDIIIERDDSSVGDGNQIGSLQFWAGEDGSEEKVAAVRAVADDAYSSSSSATRLVFETTPSGSTSASERLRIDSNGNTIFKRGSDVGNIIQVTGADTTTETLEVGITGGNAQFTATHAGGGSNTCGMTFRTRGGGSTAERMRLTSSGMQMASGHQIDLNGGAIFSKSFYFSGGGTQTVLTLAAGEVYILVAQVYNYGGTDFRHGSIFYAARTQNGSPSTTTRGGYLASQQSSSSFSISGANVQYNAGGGNPATTIYMLRLA